MGKVDVHRRELHAHCYRMLGTLVDADDALQETLVRAWRGLDRFEGRSSLRTWLFRIATNVCLTMLEHRRARLLPVDLVPASDPAAAEWVSGGDWLDPYPTEDRDGPEARAELRSSLELAFVAAAQHLSPGQRAVLLLREVFGFSAREVAEMLGTTVVAVNSSLQRARRDVRDRALSANGPTTPEPDSLAAARAYVTAWESGDLDAVVALLTADATFQMPPLRVWFQGRAAIASFLHDGPLRDRWRMIPTSANGQLAFACYIEEGDGSFIAHSLDVVTRREDQISDIIAFLRPELVTRFGHPPILGRGPAGN